MKRELWNKTDNLIFPDGIERTPQEVFAMKEFGWVSDSQLRAAKKVLWAAGDTYAIALASSALTLFRLLLMRGSRRK